MCVAVARRVERCICGKLWVWEEIGVACLKVTVNNIVGVHVLHSQKHLIHDGSGGEMHIPHNNKQQQINKNKSSTTTTIIDITYK